MLAPMRLDLSLPIEIRPLRDAGGQVAACGRATRSGRRRGGVEEWNHEAARVYRRLDYHDDGAERGGNGEVILLLRRSIAEIQASA
jgi:hypothetical protein